MFNYLINLAMLGSLTITAAHMCDAPYPYHYDTQVSFFTFIYQIGRFLMDF